MGVREGEGREGQTDRQKERETKRGSRQKKRITSNIVIFNCSIDNVNSRMRSPNLNCCGKALKFHL